MTLGIIYSKLKYNAILLLTSEQEIQSPCNRFFISFTFFPKKQMPRKIYGKMKYLQDVYYL